MATDRVSHDQAQAFYEDFSFEAGERDWLSSNPRHEQLKLLVADLLGNQRGLQLADVGCGGGTMTDFLGRYGAAVGVDFSSAAIEAARRYSSRAEFFVGGLDVLPGRRFDLIAAFDVLEHIPAHERPAFVSDLASRLAEGGRLFFSTPYPEATRHRRSMKDPTLQIIDEEVELSQVAVEAESAGLQLLRFEAYDVWKGSPEYQVMVFGLRREWGGGPELRPHRLRRRMRLMDMPGARRARRAMLAARALRRGDVRTALWFLRAKPPRVNS